MITALALFLLSDPKPLPRAHAHNDYRHERPLQEALEQGFCSVEADIFLVDGELRVGHDRKDLVPGRTLDRLYLDPLLARVRARRGSVYEERAPFFLLIDIKDDGEKTYAELRYRLSRYLEMLTTYEHLNRRGAGGDGGGAVVKPGAVTVVISGNRPVETMRREPRRWAFLDGRLADRDGTFPASHLTPLVSESFTSLFTWRGTGEVPESDRTKLREIVKRVHQSGQRLRFWAVPDRPEAWRLLRDEGVDLINTDKLKGLADFLRGTR